MRHFSTNIVLALATLLLVSSSSAQQAATTSVPNLIRYAGSLKDANGAPIATTTGVTFAIYKQQDGGAAVWMETQNIAPDANGQYSVLLGSTTATGLPSDLFLQEEQRWLGVQVQGQAEQARVMLVSVPYAFKAHEAETLGGKSISEFVLAKDLNSTNSPAGMESGSGSGSTQAASGSGNSKSPSKLQPVPNPQTFFSSALTPVVGVTETSTGNAIMASTSPTSTSYSSAVVGTITGSGPGNGILGLTSSTTGVVTGVQGITTSTNGTGVSGTAMVSTGGANGVAGYTSSVSGVGTRGVNNATTGVTYGVSGTAMSPAGIGTFGQARTTSGGTGVWGQSLATTGQAIGVLATAASSAGTGVMATESSAMGTTYGLNATVQSPNGTAAWLQNTASGPLILATTGPSSSPVTQFSVDGSGNLKFGGNLATLSIGSGADNNLFLGVGAGANDVAGSGQANTFSGYKAGTANTTGSGNTFVGDSAGNSNTMGAGNTFVGFKAGLNSLDTGSANCCNTYMGDGAGAGVGGPTAAAGNSFFGYRAGEAIETGGDKNVFSGYWSGLVTTTGIYNAFYGSNSGQNNTVGSYNTYLGAGADSGSNAGNSNIFIGFQAGSNEQGNVSNNIEIGTTGPAPESGMGPSNQILIGTLGTQTDTYVQGIYNSTAGEGPFQTVCVDSNGKLVGFDPEFGCRFFSSQKQHAVPAPQQDVIKAQQEQIEAQGQQIAELQERLSRLELLITKK